MFGRRLGLIIDVEEWRKACPCRFSATTSTVAPRLRDPVEVFSSEELALIRRFNARMGLDWGGLDILGDRRDGRIYVVDVNKTDLGPSSPCRGGTRSFR